MKPGMDKASSSLAIIAAVGLLALLASSSTASAQAGSTGGSVGKQDKSVSGGDDHEAPEAKPSPHKPARSAVEKPGKERSSKPVTGCSLAGNYSYPFQTVTVFKSDGTASNSAGPQGTWNCSGGRVTVNWNTGYVDQLIPSGGSTYSASNNHGWTWSARRM